MRTKDVNMTEDQKSYKAFQDIFIGAKIEGQGGFVNWMRIKANFLWIFDYG